MRRGAGGAPPLISRLRELAVGGLDHGGAVLVRLLVGARGARLAVARTREPAPDLLDGLAVVARPRLRGAGRPGRPAGRTLRRPLGRARRGARLVRGAGPRDVVGPVAAHDGAYDGVGQLRDLLEDPVEHPLLVGADRKSTRLNSSHEWISYAVFCLKKKK